MATNWAGNHTYAASQILRPRSCDELAEVVARAARVRAVGSGHSFTDIGDSGVAGARGGDRGVLVDLSDVPREVALDEASRTATVGGGAKYGEVADALHRRGWALPNLASLPHICVAGAVATGTHGSGVTVPSLAGSVAALTILGPDGQERSLARGDADFAGSVVALGALGIVTTVTLDVEPEFEVRQEVFVDVPLDGIVEALEEVQAAAYSVSVFTDLASDAGTHVVLKSRVDGAGDGAAGRPAVLAGAPPADSTVHPIRGLAAEAVTEQLGAPGPSYQRLPHFRWEHTPSVGAELQSEYLLPRTAGAEALGRLRALQPRLADLLRVAEVRSVAADDLWLSGAYGVDTVAFHFTWALDEPGVYGVLPAVEEALLPLGGRPHWGKCFVATAAELAPLYRRFEDFRALRERVDPGGVFANPFVERVLG